MIAACEADFNLMTCWFGGIALDGNFTIPVNVTQNGGGASWSLSSGNLTVTINPSNGSAAFVRYLLVAEMTEQFMRAQGLGWYGDHTEGSEGEGLSRFLSGQFFLLNGFGNPPAGFANSNAWLSSSRARISAASARASATDKSSDCVPVSSAAQVLSNFLRSRSAMRAALSTSPSWLLPNMPRNLAS